MKVLDRTYQIHASRDEHGGWSAYIIAQRDDGQWFWVTDKSFDPFATGADVAHWATVRIARALAATVPTQ